MELERQLEIIMENAIELNERRMFVISGKFRSKVVWLRRTLKSYLKVTRKLLKREHGELVFLWMGKDTEGEMSTEVKKALDRENIRYDFVKFKEADTVLGTNYDGLILDLNEGIAPNDLGKVIGVVKGGGIIILLMPHLEEYKKIFTRFHRMILVPPYTEEHVRRVFNRWFVKKLLEHEGITIIENCVPVKLPKIVKRKRKKRSRDLEIPEDVEVKRGILKLCATRDQLDGLLKLWKFFKEGEENIFILTSHRGRGKSSLLGLFIAALVSREKATVVITAPERSSVRELYKFLDLGLRRAKINARVMEKYDNMEDIIIKRTGSKIRYFPPYKLRRVKADLLIIDEAASIPIYILFDAMKRARKVVHSTTVHGYEGSGRSFNIIFLRSLEESKVPYVKHEMVEPIRYSEDDPIENWLFDVLLLDAEPAEITKKEMEELEISKLKYERVDMETLPFSDERKLRQLFGIFVTAHYRNNPNDFGLMCDAPHHEIRALTYNNKVICALQIAKEGGLEKEAYDMYYGDMPPGHLIPDRMIKHYRNVEFGKMEGLRVVRIAVHPDLMGKGIGSYMLSKLEKEARQHGDDWVGASFGATPRLLNFWKKNGFVPVHMAPAPNPSTGEFSTIVVKPISKKAGDLFSMARGEFIIKLVNSLPEPFDQVPVELILGVLDDGIKEKKYLPKLTDVQWKRLAFYAHSVLTFESVRDCMFEVCKAVFLADKKPELCGVHKRIILAKVLQGKSWEKVKDELGKGSIYWMIELKDVAKKLLTFYGSNKVSEREIKKLDEVFEKIREKMKNR